MQAQAINQVANGAAQDQAHCDFVKAGIHKRITADQVKIVDQDDDDANTGENRQNVVTPQKNTESGSCILSIRQTEKTCFRHRLPGIKRALNKMLGPLIKRDNQGRDCRKYDVPLNRRGAVFWHSSFFVCNSYNISPGAKPPYEPDRSADDTFRRLHNYHYPVSV